jgi:hypothetical protein
MIKPTYTETLLPAHAMQRLRQIGARHVPSKSTSTRQVYWIRERDTWVLLTRKGEKYVLGYYQMEKCPCDS